MYCMHPHSTNSSIPKYFEVGDCQNDALSILFDSFTDIYQIEAQAVVDDISIRICSLIMVILWREP